jgi:hypothetical protein
LPISHRVVDGQSLGNQLDRLRQWRVQRPWILCSRRVSSFTGETLPELRRVLTALMEDRTLFRHVGARVPLNYLMLERLTQEGRAVEPRNEDDDEGDEDDDEEDPTRINSIPEPFTWEIDITEHVAEQERKSPGL